MKTTIPLKQLLGCTLVAVLALAFAGCGTSDPRLSDETVYLGGYRPEPDDRRANFDNVSYWDGDAVQGSPSIRISLSEQRAYFYKSGELVGISTIATGREGYDTPTGSYKIIQKSRHHKSNLYGNYVDADGNVVVKDVDVRKDKKPPGTTFDGASMPYWMRIVGGVGMHVGFLPGYPA
ncbi:MAG: L,D-transpeptidase family protein, partial [Chthoniobacteraceae bacterium]